MSKQHVLRTGIRHGDTLGTIDTEQDLKHIIYHHNQAADITYHIQLKHISDFKKMRAKSASTVPLTKASHRIRVDERACGGTNVQTARLSH